MTTTNVVSADQEIVGARVGRTAATLAAYREHQRTLTPGICPFCHTEPDREVLDATDGIRVVRNRFPYAVWDSAWVEDHLMVVPVRHVLSLAEFTDAEAAESWALMRRYEAAGYSLYTRAPSNRGRSVGHLHTHLIKTGIFVD